MATLKIDLIISHVINNIQIPDGSLKTKEKARGCVKTKAHLFFNEEVTNYQFKDCNLKFSNNLKEDKDIAFFSFRLTNIYV